MNYVLDTHTWIWWNMAPDKLSKKVHRIIESEKGSIQLFLSAISIWEFCKLIENKRLVISCDPEKWIETALDDSQLTVVELSSKICLSSTRLPQPFHCDPADQLIVATAREMQADLLSKDNLIKKYEHVKSIW